MRDIRDLAQVGDYQFRRFMAACASSSRPVVCTPNLPGLRTSDQKTAKTWLSLLVSSYLVKAVVSCNFNNILKRLSKQPVMHFLDTGLVAYLSLGEQTRGVGGRCHERKIFETYAFARFI